MYQTVFSDDVLRVMQSCDVWKLERLGQPVAIIERAWDDVHGFLFLADAHGDLIFTGAYRRLAALKAHLRLWARCTAGYRPQLYPSAGQPD